MLSVHFLIFYELDDGYSCYTALPSRRQRQCSPMTSFRVGEDSGARWRRMHAVICLEYSTCIFGFCHFLNLTVLLFMQGVEGGAGAYFQDEAS